MSGIEVVLRVAGAVALLLWATRMVRTGIERAWAERLRAALRRAARRPLLGLGAGVVTAAVVQSSTATVLMAVAFASSGMLALPSALAIGLGADLGSSLVVQALSLRVGWLSPLLVLVGVSTFLASERRLPRQLGRILTGLGLLLLSLELLANAASNLTGSPTLTLVLGALGSDPSVAVLTGALIAWAAHSSVATVLLIMSLATGGLVPIATALALVLGANLGSGITAFMLCSGTTARGRRVALGNLVFRATGVVLGVLVLKYLPPDAAALGATESRQIANFHTLFNLLLALGALPLVGPAARLLERLLQPPFSLEQGIAGNGAARLDPGALSRPAEALAQATRELVRIADVVETMLRQVMPLFETGDPDQTRVLQRLDDRVDSSTSAVKLYLALLTRANLTSTEASRCQALTDFAIKLEQVGDIVDNSLLELVRKVRKQSLQFSSEGWRELTELHAEVLQTFDLAMHVLLTEDLEAARQLMTAQDRVRKREQQSRERHLKRLRGGDAESIASSTVHLDVLRDLREIGGDLTSAAYPVLERAGLLAASRLRDRRPEDVG